MKSRLFKWILRSLLIVLSIIILAVFFILLFLGPITHYALERYDKEWLGREVTVNDLNVNILNGNIYAGNVVMYEEDGSTPFASFEQLWIDANTAPVFSKDIQVHSIQLDRLFIRVDQDSTRFNFDDLIRHFNTPDTATMESEKDSTSISWQYHIRDIAILGAKVEYFNVNLNHKIGADSIDILCPSFLSDDPISQLDISISITESGSGHIQALAELDHEALTYNGRLNIDRLSFLPLDPYLKEYLNISDLTGYLNTSMGISGDFTGEHCYEGKGDLNIEELRLIDKGKDSVFTFRKLAISLDTFNSRSRFHKISSLTLEQPFIRFELYKHGDNFSALVKDELKRLPDTVITRQKGAIIPGQEYFNVFIYLGQYANYLARSYVESEYVADNITLNEGTILFRDLTMDEEVMFLLQELDVRSTKFDSRNERVRFELGALINQSAQFNADWSVDPRDVLEMDLDYTLKGLTISSLSPYSVFHTAHPLVSGNLLFTGDVHISDRRISSDNHLLIKNIDVAKKRFDNPPIKLPIRLAVVLLRDLNGNIDLDIPIRGSLDDPKFNIGKIVWYVVKNTLTKAVAAPYKFLASIFKVDESSLKEVPYEYMEFEIEKERKRRLKNVARVLKKKTQLVVEYYPKGNADLEMDFIAFDHVKKMYLDSLRADTTIDKVDSAKVMGLSPRDSLLYQFILKETRLSDQLAPVSEHCRTIMGKDSLETVYHNINRRRHDLFLSTLTTELEVDQERIRVWKPDLSIRRDTINLARPAYLLNFDVK